MNFSDALSVAEKSAEIRKLGKEGFFLSSLFSNSTSLEQDVKEWILHFFSPSKKTVVDCFVSEEGIEVGEETPALNEMAELRKEDVKLDYEEAREKVKGKPNPVSILATLSSSRIHKGASWTFNFVNADFTVLTIEINAKDGEILKEETTSIARRL